MPKKNKLDLMKYGIYLLVGVFIIYALFLLSDLISPPDLPLFSLIEIRLILSFIATLLIIVGFIKKYKWSWFLAIILFLTSFLWPIIESIIYNSGINMGMVFLLLVYLIIIFSILFKFHYFFPSKKEAKVSKYVGFVFDLILAFLMLIILTFPIWASII